jgi:hypothetical protein
MDVAWVTQWKALSRRAHLARIGRLAGLAAVAELVDAHGSGPCGLTPVKVRLLSAALRRPLGRRRDGVAEPAAFLAQAEREAGLDPISLPHSRIPSLGNIRASSFVRGAASAACFALSSAV